MMRFVSHAAVMAAGFVASIAVAAERLSLQAEDTPGVTRIEITVGDNPFSLEKPEPGVIDFVTPYRFQSVSLAKLISSSAAARVATARIVPDEEATRLRMVLNCACTFDFSVSSGVLSVRIKDPITTETPTTKPEPASDTTVATPKKPAPDFAPAPKARPNPDQSPSLVAAAPASPADFAVGAASSEPEEVEDDLNPEGTALAEVDLARDHLMRQLSRAAEQGLIQFVTEEAAAQTPPAEDVAPKVAVTETDDAKPATTPPAERQSEVRPQTEEATTSPAAPPKPVEIPLRARTAVDKNFTPDRRETRAVVAYCIDRKRLDLSSWKQAGPFLQTKLDLRTQLLDEFDQPHPDIATKLARHLILNGFGAEANALISAYGDAIEDAEVLGDLARLVDLQSLDPQGDMARTAPCHSEAALWRLIAGLPDGEPVKQTGGTPDVVDDNDLKALDAFARLPAVTRRILSARLMNNLIDKGELELAGQLDLILRRSPSPEDGALSLARARLLGETGSLEEAEALFADLGRSNRASAHRALILLLDSRMRRGADGSDQLSDALGDAAFSARGTDLEIPLKVAEIRSRTLTDGASGALEALKAEIERSGGSNSLLRDVGHAALEKLTPVEGDAIDYARAVMALRPYVSEGGAGDPARRKVANTLTEAGLPNLALVYLEPALKRENRATSLVAARTQLALDDADAALAALEGQTGPATAPIRVAALERLGRHSEAHRLASNLADTDGAASSARALRAGDWVDASAAGATPQRLLSAYMASQTSLDSAEDAQPSAAQFLRPPEVDAETTLDSVRSVVEASRSARSIIEKALEDG